MRICAIVPTYNNASTIENVISRCKTAICNVIVVNDGSTDGTEALLSKTEGVTIVNYQPNKGKGNALCRGFEKAKAMGFDYAVTIDADGQHYPEDIESLISVLTNAISQGNDRVLIVGSRNLNADGMPSANTFANKFSNFWFALQTAHRLPDTQTGFRIYPLHHLPSLKVITSRYESELELLVLSAWNGVKIVPAPVRVFYPPKNERVSHFRPFADFARISLLNTVLCIAALIYGYPSMLIHHLLQKINNSL